MFSVLSIFFFFNSGTFAGGVNQSFLINLFGCINTEYTIHEVRGLNVYVRVLKSLKGFDWPRLTASADRYRWLKYNLNAIELDSTNIKIKSTLLIRSFAH